MSNAAYNEGWQALIDQESSDLHPFKGNNPYVGGTYNYFQWESGWDDHFAGSAQFYAATGQLADAREHQRLDGYHNN